MKKDRNGDGLWLFASNFLKHPTMLGSVIPSSRSLVSRLLDPVDWDKARYLVEYGPGVGTFSREILARMHPDARLLVIELNRDFVAYLRRHIKDPRIIVHHGSAGDIESILQAHGWSGFDYGISGIPFSTLPEGIRSDILTRTRDCMSEEGEFLVFQFSPRVLPHLREVFRTVDKGFVLRNIPPAHCYRCTGGLAALNTREALAAAVS